MRRTFLILLIVAGAVLLSGRSNAGQLSDKLAEQLSQKSADEFVPVWIKLHEVQPPAALKAIGESRTLSRSERYRTVVDRLQSGHRQAQVELLEELAGMNRATLVRKVKPHWLVNIIEAEVAAGELEKLASRQDIELIFTVPEIIPIEATHTEPAAATAVGVESNIVFVRAPEVWAAGYTGQGRIICSFDTGVKGDHPAIADKWKGLDGNSAAAWFDPSDGETFPHLFFEQSSATRSHGTHVMGTLVGRDLATGNEIGMAPDAKWISAAVINIGGAAIIDAFEWAADPDGDPNSVDDLPDVINHSWRIVDIGCDQVFFDLIDATEALGIVNIFAAGNEGSNLPSDSATIGNPANRARDSIDCFAVGNVDESDPPNIVSKSSRGPSDCDSVSIKPNVCAPGLLIRSATELGYGFSSGTSMSAPHVSGLVALLRQKNPDATVDQIKATILSTTNQYSYTLPDNDFGWGVIDCKAALDALPAASTPNLRVYAFSHALISSGDTVSGTLTLQNTGTSVTNVVASITGTDPSLTVLDGTAVFGTIGADDTLTSPNTIRVVVSDTVTVGTVLSLTLEITGDAYSSGTELTFVIDPPTQRTFVTHNTGRISFSVSGFGTFGLGPSGSGGDVFFDAGGAGFLFDASENQMYEGGLMIVSNISGAVSDGVRNSIAEPDGDFLVMPGGTIEMISPGATAPEESIARFNDDRAENPLGIELLQHTFAYSSADHDDYIIIQYEIRNNNAFPLSGMYVGLYLDWDIVDYADNAGGYDAAGKFTWEAHNNGSVIRDYRACKLLDGPEGSSYTDRGIVAYFGSGGDGFTESEKRAALTYGPDTVNAYLTSSTDLLTVVASGPIFLGAGAVDTVAFALLAGDSLLDIRAAAAEAQTVYDNGLVVDVTDSDIVSLPSAFTLHQNYPNPFNPTTTIRFDLPKRSHVELIVFNILGREVVRLLDETRPAGSHEVTWDSKSALGESVASGIYAYRLKVGGSVSSRKMLLLK